MTSQMSEKDFLQATDNHMSTSIIPVAGTRHDGGVISASAETPKGSNGDRLDWENDFDPSNPMNWPTWRKVMTVGLVSAMGFSTPFASDVSAPAVSVISGYFQNSNESLKGFIVSIFLLGNAIGPIVFAPASELWGRLILFHVTNVLFIAFSIGSALANSFGVLLLMRFLAGCAGAAPLAIGGGTIADLVSREERGLYVAIFTVGGQLGPVVGPIVGAFLTEWPGWRWTFWTSAIIHGAITLACLLLLQETYAPVILKAKASKTSRQQARLMNNPPVTKAFLRAVMRPSKMLLKSPVVLFLSVFQACVFGYRYIIYTTLTSVFEDQYRFSLPDTGLTYIGSSLGTAIAVWIVTRANDRILVSRKTRSPDEQPPAEVRLLLMIVSAPICGIGLLWYGWSAQERLHWIVPILGTAIFGAGIVGASLPANIYMIDAFTDYAASGLAASFFLRFIAGGVLPLAGNPLFDRLGIGWGCTLLGVMALVLCVMPPLIYRHGEWLRKTYPLVL